jgi:23S rRNA (guanosine2251-2'-O)-methyltransferase
MANPRRSIQRLVEIANAGEGLIQGSRQGLKPLPHWERVEREALDRILGRDTVHQGVAARVAPLPETDIFELCDLGRDRNQAIILVLDQITDPHNVGAILRSAAAFGAIGIVLTERNAAPENGVLAKSASGALEHVPLVRVINLARALDELKSAGFWCVGLAAEAERTLAEAKLSGRVALCLGAEGSGLRRLTRERCDLLARLPTAGPIDQLNVSNAAAVALYELARA